MFGAVRRAPLLRGAVAVTLFGLGLVGLPAGASLHAKSGVTVDRTFLPTVTPPGYRDTGDNPYAMNLALAPNASVLYGVDALSPGFVSAYDLKSLRPLSRKGLVLDGTVTAFTRLPGRAGLLVAVSAGGRGQPTSALEQVAWSAGKLRVLSRLATPAGTLGPVQTVAGFGLDPKRHNVFVLSATAAEGSFLPGTVQLSLVQLAGHGRTPRVLWQQPLPDCQLPMTHGVPVATRLSAPLGITRDGTSLDVACSAQGSASVYKPPLAVGVGVVRLSKGSSPRYEGFELLPYPGDATEYGEGIWFPRQDRLVFQTRNVDNGGGWVVFDGDHNTYVGAVPLVQIAVQPGADLTHGRLYLMTNVAAEGLRTADVAPTPVDQGHTYAQYGTNRINEDSDYGKWPTDTTLTVDPTHHRLFVLYVTSHRFVVLHDSVPYYSTPPPPDPDQNTTDIEERPGKTGAHWSGAAQGYGSIIRQVGGASNFQYNYAPFVVNQGQTGTQQLATSFLDVLQLTGDDARASAVTAVPDNGPTTGALSQAGLQWPYHPATCDDSGAKKGAQVDSAEVSCKSARGSVTASVVGGAAGAGSGAKAADVVVSSTALSAKSTSALRRGMTTTVTSVARGISILGGQLQIGQVAATATVHAGGSAGTAHGLYSRTVSNVVLAGQKLCGQSCDPQTLAARVNEALAGRAAIAFPTPDRQLREGSPGGYQALVRRDLYGQTQETQLNDQDPNRAEVPAMEITVFEDNTIKSRTVAYLAGVEAEAHYGIYRLSCTTCSSAPVPDDQVASHSPGSTTAGDDVTSLPSTSQTTTASSPEVAAPASGVIGALRHGWQFLANGISEVIRLFGVWLLLLAPVYLSARRWLMLSRRSRP